MSSSERPFLFQAEDGIRDYKVTGVQTCALPISVAESSIAPQKPALLLLFVTGLITMGMEVVWIRLFTPSIGPMVYSFALILASYLFADRKSTRLNSSHLVISYAVFCLKKKKSTA